MSRILPAAATCSLISAKVSYGKCDGIADTKPDDQAIKRIPGMAFFFSAVAAIERIGKKSHTNEDTEEEGDEKNSSDKQQVVYWPAISYWVAV